ncbi:MAG: histidine triad nucleotide-binding protein [Gammaproteobacteria bacterium]|jgi:histidine triad (HIT) family protein|nr:histidine triad nucleotide-binding protein [Gammaproteobacteria bacterium]MDH3756551.1 histidine triad nucleotide-binding protein [Gammaproteobacteria bacterium]MDH3846850.1 histidine triad nucleotide-binding protein [Gammaproteobacteria bacterium]MDH3863330.1 histidine triad nucleotide-binding protein [Gammaproteobacteria bacterium]MDH3905631.1 histidine triad nucleotide-binding protein [Gammaproteobacteria bacterium]
MSEHDCLFCKIVNGDLGADIVYENESLIAFRDINPIAPTHILLIPRRHVATMNDLQDGDASLVGELFLTAARIAANEGLAEDGYRVVMNCNEAAGQSVFHIHLHLMGGRAMTWPPG